MIRANGGTCVGYKVDISKKEEVYKAADAIRRDVGDVSIFIYIYFVEAFYVLFFIDLLLSLRKMNQHNEKKEEKNDRILCCDKTNFKSYFQITTDLTTRNFSTAI